MFYILTKPDAAPVYPYTLTDLRRDNPQVSFPRDLTNFDTVPWHCHPVQPTEQPSEAGKLASRAAPELVDGVWYERWVLVDAPPPPVPEQVSMRQARLALLGAGLLQTVEKAIEDETDPVKQQQARIVWEYSTEVARNHPMVTELQTLLGLTSEQIDQMFVQAAQL